MLFRKLILIGTLMFGTALMIMGCDDDDSNNTNNTDVCENVDCGEHGQCAVVNNAASCDCDTGYHADGLTCVEDGGNTAPAFTSTPTQDATAGELYSYSIACSDTDGDTLTLSIGTSDTCDATLVDNGDGTGNYSFQAVIPLPAGSESCVLDIACTDGTEIATQSVTITISGGGTECHDSTEWVGQFLGTTDATSIDGGTITTTAWTTAYDSGLDELVALMPATSGDSTEVNVVITEVTVIATYQDATQVRMYVADGNGAFKVYLSDDATQIPSFVPQTGQKISFTATEIMNYGGTPEITAVADNSIVFVSANNEVAVSDHTGGPAMTITQVNQIVRVTGTIVSAGTGCGAGYTCYDLDYGSGTNVVFRTATVVESGDCISYVGPVTLFNNAPQLTSYNPTWEKAW
ncbi:hypothetical protein KKF34_03995 [Myxococcota bacterium]|nr:hypothetical protein [Myxococcota bacterium]MBU1381794.1 hypothetical protein [Myxococcota bacterium]MBU1496018.1 hypothetical protein [Myxococcota bacterium]